MTTVESSEAIPYSYEPEEALPVSEHTLRVQRALGVIDEVAELVGDKELDIISISSAEDIKPDPGVYILEEYGFGDKPIDDAKFRLEPVLLSGMAGTAHTVIAGDLLVESEDGEQKTAQVAAKCYLKRDFVDRLTRAVREVAFMEELGRREEITTVPIAVVVAPQTAELNREVVVLTAYNPKLLSLNNNAWGRGLTPANKTKALQAVKAIARFNTGGGMHGDAKIKNVAEVEGEGMAMIDYETSRGINPLLPQDAERAAFQDFSLFIKSLCDVGFLSDDAASKETVEDLAEEYLARWDGYSLDVQNSVATSIAAVLENVDFPHKRFEPAPTWN